MVQALVLGGTGLSRVIRTWHILALSLFIGIVNAFDIPDRQSFVLEWWRKRRTLETR